MKNVSSATGNRTPVSRVTGGDTSHYTIADAYIIFNFGDQFIYKNVACLKLLKLGTWHPNLPTNNESKSVTHRGVVSCGAPTSPNIYIGRNSTKFGNHMIHKLFVYFSTKILLAMVLRHPSKWSKYAQL